MRFRLAVPADDGELRRLMRENVMPGRVSIGMTCEPSFFDAIEVEGRATTVVVAEGDGRLDGAGVIAKREAYLDGRPFEYGYLGGLRGDRRARGGTGLSRGYAYFRELRRSLGVDLYLTSILDGNAYARAVLTSGRAGLPAYVPAGRYATFLMPTSPQCASRTPQVEFVDGEALGAEEIVRILDGLGRTVPLFPVHRVEDLHNSGGVLRGLGPADFLVARCNGRPAGIAAVWDQRAFRQVRVESYREPWGGVARGYNALAWRCSWPTAPPAGGVLDLCFLSCVAVDPDQPEVLAAIVREARRRAARRGCGFLVAGACTTDPGAGVLRSFFHLRFDSTIYSVAWNSDAALVPFTPPYFHLDPATL